MIITLPSEHTLRDYTHVFQAKPGIQPEVNNQLGKEVKVDWLEEWQTNVCVVFDEVKIKEGLVYDKHTGNTLGFTNFGDMNQEMDKLRDQLDKNGDVATSMLVFMVQGLCKFPYGQFPCIALTARTLSPIVTRVYLDPHPSRPAGKWLEI